MPRQLEEGLVKSDLCAARCFLLGPVKEREGVARVWFGPRQGSLEGLDLKQAGQPNQARDVLWTPLERLLKGFAASREGGPRGDSSQDRLGIALGAVAIASFSGACEDR